MPVAAKASKCCESRLAKLVDLIRVPISMFRICAASVKLAEEIKAVSGGVKMYPLGGQEH